MGFEDLKFSDNRSHNPPSLDLTDRPVRDTIISSDEITNLCILLNTTNDVNEFLAVIK
jgi:hypothetical protein